MPLKNRSFSTIFLWIAALQIYFTFFTIKPIYSSDRAALVIGNADYNHAGRLANPENDAAAISAVLRRLEFEVTFAENLEKSKFEQKLLHFSDKSSRSKIALIYYAGHGLECNGENYLIPVNARLKADNHIKFECISLNSILSAVEGAKTLKLVLLDACRDNPFTKTMRRSVRTRSVGRGLARIETRPGVLVSYAAAAGKTADDGKEGHSPYDLGLYDMHGNVHEWCQDRYGDYPAGSKINPEGPAFGVYRVLRGGSWNSHAKRCRSANRDGSNPDYRYNYLGFRLAVSSVIR